ncbi:hypothetical protein Droror1_Dr00022652 [Drosera rotundifolia]
MELVSNLLRSRHSNGKLRGETTALLHPGLRQHSGNPAERKPAAAGKAGDDSGGASPSSWLRMCWIPLLVAVVQESSRDGGLDWEAAARRFPLCWSLATQPEVLRGRRRVWEPFLVRLRWVGGRTLTGNDQGSWARAAAGNLHRKKQKAAGCARNRVNS